MTGKSKLGAVHLLVIIAFLGFSYFSLVSNIPAVSSAPGDLIKPLHFFMHNQTSNPWVGGYTQTTATLNTTQKWREKPMGYRNVSGRLWLDFYVNPDLASNLSLNGTLWLHLWMCGYGTGGSIVGAGFTSAVYEVTSTGQTLVGSTESSGSQDLAFGSTPADSRDVNSVAGNSPLILHFPSYTFGNGSSILVHVEANPQGAGATIFFYFDSQVSPSYVTLYSEDIVNIPSVWTANATGAPQSQFMPTGEPEVIQINANVTDPLGGYDFNASLVDRKDAFVTVAVVDPEGVFVVDNERMTLTSGGTANFVNLFQHNWTFSTVLPGQYNVTVTATDNSGNVANATNIFWIGQTVSIRVQTLDFKMRPLIDARVAASTEEYVALSETTNATGWIDTQIISGTYNFTVTWQSVIVNSTVNTFVDANTTLTLYCMVYDPSFLFVDDVNDPLPEAQVFIEWPNGTINPLPKYTAENGFVNITYAPAGTYRFTLYWKNVKVLQTTQNVISDGPYTLKCEVYQLIVKVIGNNGAPVTGAYVIIYTQTGIVYDFGMTETTGETTSKLPVGTYKIEVQYSTTFWLSAITANATLPSEEVTSSHLATVTLTDFPPQIWTTTAFVLVIALVIAAAAVIFGFLIKRRRP